MRGSDAKRTIAALPAGRETEGFWMLSETSNALNRLEAMELRTLGA